MALGLLGARLVLALVFVTAAVGKLRDWSGFRRAVEAFGIPPVLSSFVAAIIPPAELTAAAALVPASIARQGAAASLGLLALFTAAAGINLARGRTPSCACFGATSEPIGSATIVRNTLLAGCALLVIAAGPGAPLASALAAWTASSIDERFLLTMALALVAALIAASRSASQLRSINAGLSSRIASLQQELAIAEAEPAEAIGLPRGAEAPAFDFVRLEGDRASLGTLRQAGLPILLIFSDVYCSACAQLWPDVEKWQREYAGALTVAVICGGASQLVEMKLMGTSVANVLLAEDAKVNDSYLLPLTPSAVFIGADGKIESGGATGIGAIRGLVRRRMQETARAG
jgi:uncharacterized membrane protein YphA (DoxX/SURF4 family)